MPDQNNTPTPPAISDMKYNFFKSQVQDAFSRDKTKSLRPHEPNFRNLMIDPMTGQYFKKVDKKPHKINGNLTVLFSTEFNRKPYVGSPVDKPNIRLPFPPGKDKDRGG